MRVLLAVALCVLSLTAAEADPSKGLVELSKGSDQKATGTDKVGSFLESLLGKLGEQKSGNVISGVIKKAAAIAKVLGGKDDELGGIECGKDGETVNEGSDLGDGRREENSANCTNCGPVLFPKTNPAPGKGQDGGKKDKKGGGIGQGNNLGGQDGGKAEGSGQPSATTERANTGNVGNGTSAPCLDCGPVQFPITNSRQ